MTRRSLRLRLLAGSALSIAAALVLAGLGLVFLFERHVERRVDGELETYLRQIAGNIAFNPDGTISLSPQPADPRFDQPLSGLYWQIEDEKSGQRLRSRSLWDTALALPADRLGRLVIHRHELPGPAGTELVVREREVLFPDRGAERPLRLAVAIDRAEIARATRDFGADMAPSLLLLGLVLLAAGWLQVRVGLQPLEAVRRGVEAIHAGTLKRLASDYPDEVLPLAEEINDLLDAQEKAIERSRGRAADLAHGLRTPLSVLAADARLLRARGEGEIADDIDELAETMRRHAERAIAQTRLRPRRGLSTALTPAIARLVTTIRKTPRGEALEWTIDIAPDARAAIDEDDLIELAGNLIENASKWARGRVHISGGTATDGAFLRIEDDGPGIPEAKREAALRRGGRLDAGAPGSGLGLAIVGDIVESYGGALHLEESALGGLCARIVLPAAAGRPA
ncbi:MAG TPA: sensor histidine kinase [Parvibaculum sp.]|uniref:sensor histidine kinase n=1 Tax=Parvibaculum sp. TaxID=2024848 RepID=UPI002C1DF7AD|nr:sensor histidine kinase [Parvibaculum sp.]HMM15873.1 sensor histidine kinase [Parvibaculum sp.]